MPFKPGQSGNPKGRIPGTKNRVTQQIESLFAYFAEEGSDRARRILDEMPDSEFIQYYFKSVEFVKPKLRAIESDNTHDIVIRIQDETDDPRDND